MVYQRLAHLLKIRSVQPAFHPHGKQRVLGSQPEVFALMRVSPDGGERVLCLVNLADQPQPIRVDLADLGAEIAFDLIDRGKEHYERLSIDLPPYQIVWLKLA
jgi:sucrose phosphorylase